MNNRDSPIKLHDIMIAAGFTCAADQPAEDDTPRVYYRAGEDFPLAIVYVSGNRLRIVRRGGSQEWCALK